MSFGFLPQALLEMEFYILLSFHLSTCRLDFTSLFDLMCATQENFVKEIGGILFKLTVAGMAGLLSILS